MNEVALIISIVFGTTGGIVGISSYIKNNKKDTKQEIREDTTDSVKIKAQLDYIAKGVDDIRLDVKDHSRQITSLTCEIVELRENCKSAHKRIDGLERGDV